MGTRAQNRIILIEEAIDECGRFINAAREEQERLEATDWNCGGKLNAAMKRQSLTLSAKLVQIRQQSL